MSALIGEVYEAFRAMEVPEDKALKAAEALSRRDNDVTSLRADLATTKTAIEAKITLLQWMMGFVLAFQVAIFVKLFLH